MSIFIGRNAVENWHLIDHADKNDIWYHLKSLPSPHVICSDKNKFIECAKLCKQHSKYKNFQNIKVLYTPVSNLTKGKETGSVCFKSKRKVKTVSII